jgi:hypothetical protein
MLLGLDLLTSPTTVGTPFKRRQALLATGTRLALVSNRSKIRHPEGKNTVTTASPASTRQLRTLRRRFGRQTVDVSVRHASRNLLSLFFL